MTTLFKRYATAFVLATSAVLAVPMPAMAERVIVKESAHSRGGKVIVVQKQRHKQAVGHRFRTTDVVVIKDWKARGLRSPGRNEVYVRNGDSIYLAAAATLIVKALIN